MTDSVFACLVYIEVSFLFIFLSKILSLLSLWLETMNIYISAAIPKKNMYTHRNTLSSYN